VTRTIPEADWKIYRELNPLALQRLCERILAEVRAETQKPGKTAHEKYLSVFNLVKRRDRDIARAFDDFRRSTALTQIGILHQMGLLTIEELNRFSPETRQILALFASISES
jgi:hypothetical protein